MKTWAVMNTARRRVAVACRILAHAGLSEDVLGHVSVRVDDDTILVRARRLVPARGPAEAGLLFTSPEDVVACSLATPTAPAGADYTLPNELPIHLACYRADPAVGAVVHAHPPWLIAADLAGVALVPLVGAYNIPAARLAADGIAVYPRGVLINTDELGGEMVAAMGGRPVCVLRGHGLTSTGATVEQAVARALAVDSLARMAARVTALGGEVRPLPREDLEQLPDLGSGFNDELLWRHHEERLRRAGLGIAIGREGGEA
jgi:ribulose-5-phosphate 4-epimerase/fuculose-1-phosphate aldolase